jgi:hypothetical protein
MKQGAMKTRCYENKVLWNKVLWKQGVMKTRCYGNKVLWNKVLWKQGAMETRCYETRCYERCENLKEVIWTEVQVIIYWVLYKYDMVPGQYVLRLPRCLMRGTLYTLQLLWSEFVLNILITFVASICTYSITDINLLKTLVSLLTYFWAFLQSR